MKRSARDTGPRKRRDTVEETVRLGEVPALGLGLYLCKSDEDGSPKLKAATPGRLSAAAPLATTAKGRQAGAHARGGAPLCGRALPPPPHEGR